MAKAAKKRKAADIVAHDKNKERARKFASDASKSGRDIGAIPPVVNPRRRMAAMKSLACYCTTYHGATFSLAWSLDHLKAIAQMEEAISHGGLFAFAMPRGNGKTSLCIAGSEWAVLTGRRAFVALIGATDDAAGELLKSLKMDFLENEKLHEDFPEVCHAIVKLGGIGNRAAGQLYKGKLTHIKWGTSKIIMPTIPGSAASGAIICVAGITGRVRGMQHKHRDGRTLRPDLFILDDPQTDETARSPEQCKTRIKVLSGMCKMGGPNKKMAGFMPCTVIYPDDMADTILDNTKHPLWGGERMKLIYEFPDESKPIDGSDRRPLWNEYWDIYDEDLQLKMGARSMLRATAFYKKNLVAMRKGAAVAWPERFVDGEIDALQHAMNQMYTDAPGFWAELQNEPIDENKDDDILTADEIVKKFNRIGRGVVPNDATKITAYIDIHKKALYYVVAAWAPGFTGYVIDYGTYPDQKRSQFLLRDIQHTLKVDAPTAGTEGCIRKGLEGLTGLIMGQEWTREDGAVMRVDLCMIDANWGLSKNTVYTFARNSLHAANILPSHGQGLTASSIPISEKKAKPGERRGEEWSIPVPTRQKGRHIFYDTNHWKTFIHTRLAVEIGDKGALSLFGDRVSTHRMFAEHLTAEFRTQTEGRGRVVYEWKMPPARPDNHYLDCLVGCAVAASTEGMALPGLDGSNAKKRKRVSFAKLSADQRNNRRVG